MDREQDGASQENIVPWSLPDAASRGRKLGPCPGGGAPFLEHEPTRKQSFNG